MRIAQQKNCEFYVNKIVLVTLFTVFCLLNTFKISAQFPQQVLKHYSVDDGLAQSTINCILQDSKGYVWIGTCGGLSRFDGYTFKNFKSHPDFPNSLTNNFIRSLFEDSLGNIWVGSETGLDVINNKTGKIEHPITKNPNLIQSCYAFHFQNNNLLFTDNAGHIRALNLNTHQQTILQTSKHLYGIVNIFEKTDSRIWFISYYSRCIIEYDYQKNTLKKIDFPPDYFNSYIYCIKKINNNELLIITDIKTFKFNIITNIFTPLTSKGSCFESLKFITKDLKYGWWLTKKNGDIIKCDNNFNEIHTFSLNKNNQKWGTQPLTFSYSDRENNLWLGIDGGDLYKFSPDLIKFNTFRFAEQHTQNSNFIKCIYKEKSKDLIVSTFEGLYSINQDFTKVKTLILGNQKNVRVNKILQLTNKKIIIGCNIGIYIYDIEKQKTLQYIDFALNEKNKLDEIRSLIQLKDGRIFVGGKSGFYSLKETINGNFELSKLLSIESSNLFEIGNNQLVNSQSRNSICVIKIKNNQVDSYYYHVLPSKYDFSSFRYFYRDKKNRIWCASSIGLIKFDEHLKILKIFTESDGLSDNDLYGILEDKLGHLWISSNKGISKFNPENQVFSNYDVSDGLQANEFNSNAFCFESETMYFGGINGLSYFEPSKINASALSPNVCITNFDVIGEKNKSFNEEISAKKVTLNYFQNFVSIEVSALQYGYPDKNLYSFYLKGYDKNWVEQGNKRSIRYNNLEPGTYEFWVKASNFDKKWFPPKKLMTIEIIPPFWKTPIFKFSIILLVIILIPLLVFSIFKFKINKKNRIIEQLRQIEEVRATISRDLHDNAGAELTRISMMSELAKIESNTQIDITPRLNQITNSSKNLVENFKEIIWATNPQNDNLESLIIYIRAYISDFLENFPMDIKFEIPTSISKIEMKANIRRNIFLIIKEWINNVVKHSEASLIYFKFSIENNQIQIKISDNGIGLKKENKRGNGLKNIERRSAEIKAICEIYPREEKGCELSFKMNLE